MSQSESFNDITVSRRGTKIGPDPRTINRRAQKVLRAMSIAGRELSVVLCDDQFIWQLNRDYRHLDRPTDVLSFPMDDMDGMGSARPLGDVIISMETAARQATERHQSLTTEVTFLLIHGILHLNGYTHENDDDEREMNQRAVQLMKLFP